MKLFLCVCVGISKNETMVIRKCLQEIKLLLDGSFPSRYFVEIKWNFIVFFLPSYRTIEKFIVN